MHDSRVHEWEMGSEVAGWAGVKGVQGESMVTGLVNEGNGLKIKHKMHVDKLIFNKKIHQKLPMLTFSHQNRIPVYIEKYSNHMKKKEQVGYRKNTCAAILFQTFLLRFSSMSSS